MRKQICFFAAVFFQLFVFGASSAFSQNTSDASVGEFVGRFTDGKDYAVYFAETKYGMTIRPVMWTATQLLGKTGEDKFTVIDRISRGADFVRDAQGRVSGVSIRGMDGEGLKLIKSEEPLLPVELFLAGRTHDAAKAYAARGAAGEATAVDDAAAVLRRLPTKSRSVIALLLELAPHFQSDARFHTFLGFAYVKAGDRRAGLAEFQKAYALGPTNKEAISGLARLNALPSSAKSGIGWKNPFSLDAIFAKPTAQEIADVEADWASRDLTARDVREEYRSTVDFGYWKANVRIVSHLVHGSRHYGAIIIPANARAGCCAVIVEAKGVSPTYFPLELEPLHSPLMMGAMRDRFIYVVPSFRGEVLNFEGKTFRSEGDRRDALDGATDDAIAMLNVALQTTPEADGKRICAFGQSRGGTVALLLGIRDKRIDCVVDWSGPTDWFYLMGTDGWTEKELWAEGIRTHANTEETGGQNVERFLMKAIEGHTTLAQVRHNMLASSPLYFAKHLPLSQFHYGLEDPSVPSRNGYGLVRELERNKVPTNRYKAFFYPNEGHDTDRIAAPPTSAEFIIKALGVK